MKRVNFDIKDRRMLYIVLSLVLVCVFTLTIAYSVLSVTLNITGTADISAATWDVHLDNVQLNSNSVTESVPVITNGTTATFSTSLTIPGDFYEFTVDVVNDGSIDAMIDSITKTPTLTDSQAKYLNYTVEYQNGEAITTKQLVEKDSFVRLKVRVEFRKDITASDLPTVSETLNLAFTVNYVQSDESGTNVNGDGKLIYADGNISEIGTIVTIGSEQFYTIGTEGDNVKMLSMYNLHVGNQYDTTNGVVPLASPTGMQSELASTDFGDYSSIGVTAFSNTSTSYSGSIVEGYVNNYKTILESNYGIDIVEARLIYYDELTDSETFACVEFEQCSDKYSWIHGESYWTGTAYDSVYVWYLDNALRTINGNYLYDDCNGVRPVIVISQDYFN